MVDEKPAEVITVDGDMLESVTIRRKKQDMESADPRPKGKPMSQDPAYQITIRERLAEYSPAELFAHCVKNNIKLTPKEG